MVPVAGSDLLAPSRGRLMFEMLRCQAEAAWQSARLNRTAFRVRPAGDARQCQTFATSGPYRLVMRRVVLPWVMQGEQPAGEGLEIGAGGGAMTARLLAALPSTWWPPTTTLTSSSGPRQAVMSLGERVRGLGDDADLVLLALLAGVIAAARMASA